jgi:hypothetical protein
VEDALEPFGVRIRAIPLNPPKVLELIQSSQAADSRRL